MGDFISLAQMNLPVKVVIFNNSVLGFVAMEMKAGAIWLMAPIYIILILPLLPMRRELKVFALRKAKILMKH